MAVAFVQEFMIEGDDRTTANYDRVNERLAHNHPAPDGLLIHYAGFDEDAGVFRIVNVWETRQQGQAYRDEHVLPAVRELIPEGAGAPLGRETTYELHHVAKP
jgi:hypothetical protein